MKKNAILLSQVPYITQKIIHKEHRKTWKRRVVSADSCRESPVGARRWKRVYEDGLGVAWLKILGHDGSARYSVGV
jgi:hypothetical protein